MTVDALARPSREVSAAIALACDLGESPVWHPSARTLWWVDIAGRRLHRWRPGDGEDPGTLDHWDLPSEPGCCAPALDGSVWLAMRDGLWRFDPASGRCTSLAAPPYEPSVERFNDGKCDPLGRWWIGTIFEPRDRAQAALHRFDRGTLDRVAGDVTVANGLAFSPDARTMYWADTKAHRITAFDFDLAAGTLSRPRVFAQFPTRETLPPGSVYGGRPDGAAVDAQGRLWVAMYEGAAVICLDAEGRLVDRVDLPVQCPTMPCFGGDDLRTLFITTARHGRPAAERLDQPLAGCVLSVRLEVAGWPAHLADPGRLRLA